VKLTEGVEWALHCLIVLSALPPDRALAAGRLAEFHGVPPAYLAKHLQALSRAGVLRTLTGPRGGYQLARPAADINVLEVIHAVDGPSPAFECTEIRRRGPIALPDGRYRALCGVHRAMLTAEAAYNDVLRRTSIATLAETTWRDADPEALRKGAAWMLEVLR
jgi:Rrf2 family protein